LPFKDVSSKAAPAKSWKEKPWIYDLRTNKHFTLKENPLKRSDLDDFVVVRYFAQWNIFT
jgi:hypothetical protein